MRLRKATATCVAAAIIVTGRGLDWDGIDHLGRVCLDRALTDQDLPDQDFPDLDCLAKYNLAN